MSHLRLGTRGSALALAQSTWVAEQLRRLHPGLEVELITITTRGDRILDRALSQVGGKGLFVTEIETALLAREIDLAVHSLKDVPTEQPDGLRLAAFPERADPRDVLVKKGDRHHFRLDVGENGVCPPFSLPHGALIGTSSLRRAAQLRHVRPDLRFTPIRGNVDTRVRKLQEGQADAIVLAAAGLLRLGRAELITEYLGTDICVPAAGQGILCLEARADDAATLDRLRPLDCAESRACAAAERHVIAALGGSCQVPIGAFAEVHAEALHITAVVSDLEGQRVIRAFAEGPTSRPDEAADAVTRALRDQGGDAVLREILGD